ncbi:MAG: hypothetical protein AAFA34_03205 [Thermoplasmata archaeon]
MKSFYGLVPVVALVAALSLAGTAFSQTLESASYVQRGTDLVWTITLDNLTLGDNIMFSAGPSPSDLYPLDLVDGQTALFGIGRTTQTYVFTSLEPTQDGTPVALFYLQGTELNTAVPAVPPQFPTNILSLNATGQLPEVPLALGLPLMGLAAAAAVTMRRRHGASLG